ncbi:MAG TPA: ABC transporter permease [Burkholderiales bacterium]|nr:ABC transporter permease [Burkholderiales bacterium]
MSSIAIQLLNGLASASTLFLVAAGLSLIFGVTRVVNFAHGALYMLGIYCAYSFIGAFGATPLGFWAGVAAAALSVGALGAVLEIALLRRLYRAPELLQLLATFALTLVIKDCALALWGAADLLGPRAPGLRGSVEIAGSPFPQYDLVLIAIGPAVLGALWLLLSRTRWGRLVRAATQDRDMVAALGVNQKWLFTGVFALGAALAGLGGALQIPREPAQLSLDIAAISDAFVVVVLGGMGSIPGAFLAALLIGEIKALCIAAGLSKLTLVAEFVVMAVVLVLRPQGLLGRPWTDLRTTPAEAEPLRPWNRAGKAVVIVALVALATLPLATDGYALVLAIDVFVFALFAASLHFILGPGGMVSFGHAAYLGLGAYGAGLLLQKAGWPMEAALAAAPLAALAGAMLFGWFCVRLSGVYLAMLTLAFAQIVWSIAYEWDILTGGSNGMVGVWPSAWLASRPAFYQLTLALCALGLWLMRRALFAPFGWALRAGRDSPLRAAAIGIDVRRVQWLAFAAAGTFAGLAGGLYAFSKGSISPDSTLAVSRSVDALVMVLLGGVQTLTGPLAGAAVYTWLQDAIARNTDYWRALLGVAILAIVLAFPQGIVGALRALRGSRGDA